jgi:lipopolysaccharide transport system permease protein
MVVREASTVIRHFKRSWRVLWALTLIDVQRKYAGSVLGMLWYPTYSALILASYCFVYLVVFRVRFKEFGSYQYVLFVFAGLIPYLGFSEAVVTGASSVRQNLAILRNAVFPVEFIPVRAVGAAMVGLLSSLAVLTGMITLAGFGGWHLLYLPVALASLFGFSVAVAWVISALTVLLPDVSQVVNVCMMLLMFVSPVGYTVDMVPQRARLLVYLNPLTYLIDQFRFTFLGVRVSPLWVDAAFLAASIAALLLSATFFRRLSPLFADYE